MTVTASTPQSTSAGPPDPTTAEQDLARTLAQAKEAQVSAETAAIAAQFVVRHLTGLLAGTRGPSGSDSSSPARRPGAPSGTRTAAQSIPIPPRRTEAYEWEPPPNKAGNRFWFVRGHPSLEPGIHTTVSLRRAGVDPEVPQASGLKKGWKTLPTAAKYASQLGDQYSVIWWW